MSTSLVGKPMKDLKGYLDIADIRKLLSVIKKPRDKLLFLLLFETGARISEIVGDISWKDKRKIFYGLTLDRINWQEHALILETLKRRKYPPPYRMVNVTKRTMKLLLAYVKENGLQGKSKVFNISRVQAFRLFRKYGKEAGVLDVGTKLLHPHHARHSDAIAEIKHHNTLEGLRKLQKKLGHANIETTAEYLQFSPDRKKEVEETFSDL